LPNRRGRIFPFQEAFQCRNRSASTSAPQLNPTPRKNPSKTKQTESEENCDKILLPIN